MDSQKNAITQAVEAIQAHQQPAPSRQKTSTSTQRGSEASPEQRRAVNYFYGRVKSVYGSKYKATFPSQSDEDLSKREWSGQVMNLNETHIDRGIGRLKENIVRGQNDYLWPNIPLIAALCHPSPEDFGLPTLDQAWAEAQANAHHVDKHTWSHEAVRIAGKSLWFDMLQAVDKHRRAELKKRFSQRYALQVGRVMNHQPLQDHHSLESDTANTASQSVAERSKIYHNNQHAKAMEAMGINPKGGRAEFLKRMQGGKR